MQKVTEKKINKKSETGFTLVETLVAIGILSISILATFTAVQAGLQSSVNVKDTITAYYLAQEGMELIRNIRDDNALNSISGGANTWLTGLASVGGDPCYFGKICIIDSKTKIASTCSGTCPAIKQDSNGLFGYVSGTATKFRRDIQFMELVPAYTDEKMVYITIYWTSGGVAKSFQVTETLFNRQ